MVLLAKVFDDAHVMPMLAQVSLESCCAESETPFFGSAGPASLWTLQLESWIQLQERATPSTSLPSLFHPLPSFYAPAVLRKDCPTTGMHLT